MVRSLWKIEALFYHRFRGNPFSRLILRRENEQLLQLLPELSGVSPLNIVDAGTGDGNSLKILRRRYSQRLIAMDPVREMLRRSRRKIPDGHYLQGDGMTLPFRSGSINLVSAIGLAEYLRDLSLFLKEVYRILVPGGYLILTISPPGFLNYLRFLIGHRLFLREEAEVKELFQNRSFEVCDSRRTLLQQQYLLRKQPIGRKDHEWGK